MPSPPERRPAGVRGTASGAAAKFSSMAAIGLASFDKLSPKILSRFAADITGSGSAISAASDEETRFSRPWPSYAGNGAGTEAPAVLWAGGAAMSAASGSEGEGWGEGVGEVVGYAAAAGGGVAAAASGEEERSGSDGRDGMACELDIGENGKSIDGIDANVPPLGRLGALGGKLNGVAPAVACCGAPPPSSAAPGVGPRPPEAGVPGMVSSVGAINVLPDMLRI